MREPRVRVSGVLALFEDRERMLAAVRRAKADGLLRLTAYAPAYDCELVEAASSATWLGIGPFTASAGALGWMAALVGTIWTTLQWPVLMVGGKPLVAMPPFLVVAFESLILFAAAATAGMLVVRAIGARPRRGAVYDPRVSDGVFGLWIECPISRAAAIAAMMQTLGAIECRVV